MPSVRTKQRRSTRACDFCHTRGTRCRQDNIEAVFGHVTCTTCVEYGEQCTWDRTPRKRGTKPGNASGLKKATSWKRKVLNDRESISSLLDVYLDTIHPVFPLYCERELWVGWRASTFPESSSQYASLISMCALSAQHAQQGSLFEDDRPLRELAASAEPYLTEATSLVLAQQPDVLDLELIRSCGFLALFGIQTGNRTMIHKYLGMYHSVCAQFSLHDESHWDDIDDLSVCEIETRRRLYWAMYRLEVHSACVLGHMIRLPEIQSNVNYPAGLHHPAFVPGRDGDFEDWFAGWNTTTDLYRILEHAIVDFRAARRRRTNVKAQSQSLKDMDLQQRLSEIQIKALPQFDQAYEKSTDNGRNRCGFQATNILFTIHMIRMFLSIGSQGETLEAAETLLESVQKIPTAYIRASGTPLLQEIAGTGLMLGATAAKASTVPEEARRLLTLQDSLAAFLEMHASANGTAISLASRLREQFSQLNNHLAHTDVPTGADANNCEQLRDDAWDEDINELFRFDPFSCETGIMPMHFRPGFLVDFA